MKIGVFDSGVGGQAFVNAIQKGLPEAEVILKTDTEHLPYGNKTPDELFGYVVPILQTMEDCQAIVVACNTVSTTIIDRLREVIKVPLIAVEPMVKPAAAVTKSGIIAVCATPATLASDRYRWLKETYAKDLTVMEPDCSDWAKMVEDNDVDREAIQERINGACESGADVIVLGCTHYHWIEKIILEFAAGRATVIQPESPVVEQLKRVLTQTA